MKQIVLVISAAALLAGCSSTAQPPASAPTKPQTRCEMIIELVRHAWATPEEKAMAFELGRNEGCFGRPQTQSLDVTVRPAQ